MNVLYIGPCDSEWAQMNRPVNMAAAKWGRGFAQALSSRCRLTALTHTHERQWPAGSVLWRGHDARLYSAGLDVVSISYPCVRRVREWWWGMFYARTAIELIRARRIDAVFIYNCHERWRVSVLEAIRREFGGTVKVCPIVLDGDDPRKDDWAWLKRAARVSDGFVTLSWWVHCRMAEQCGRPSFHLDGGADGWQGRPPSDSHSKTLVYTGLLDVWHGADFLCALVDRFVKGDVRLVFCGKDSDGAFTRRIRGNPNVDLRGFVSEEELREVCNNADVLLNVRNPNHPDNVLNCPSKVGQYLSFGRAVASVPLPSLAPCYAEVVHFPKDDTVDSFCELLDGLLSREWAQKMEEYVRIKEWFGRHKRWDVLIDGLLSWAEGGVR